MACEICDDTRWKTIEVNGVSRVTRCDCWWQLVSQQQLSSAGIPHRYRHCSLSNFRTELDPHRDALRKAEKFIENYPAVQRGLMLIGPYGVGKTHLAIAILRELIVRKAARGHFFEVPELLKRIRDTYDRNRELDELQVLEPVLHADLLVLDDLGEERTSEWVQETLAHVINVRYSQNRATIFTTGLTDSADSTEPKSFIHKLGGRTRSRLIEMCTWIYIDTIDTREIGPDPTPSRIAEWQEKSPLSPQNIERARKGELPPKASRQLKAKIKEGPRQQGGELKWPGGRAGS